MGQNVPQAAPDKHRFSGGNAARRVEENAETENFRPPYLNLFHWEFDGSEVDFESLPCDEYTAQALMTAFKSKAFDELESEGAFPGGELERRMETWGWCG